MKLKLSEKISYQDKNNELVETDYIYIKKPTVEDLIRKNIGLFSAIIHKTQKYLVLGQKVISDNIIVDENDEEIQEKADNIFDNDENILQTANSLVYGCVMGGYDDFEKDLLEKCPVYFDKFLFVDEEMEKNISGNMIKKQLEESGDIFDLYKIIFAFFFQVSNSSSTRKIEK